MNTKSSGSRRLARPSRTSTRSQGQPLWQHLAWKPVALPLALVAIVLAMSLAANGKQAPHETEPASGVAITLSRTLSCVQDAPRSSMRIGTVPASSTGYTLGSGKPGRVVFAPRAAASGYASQWASGKGWVAARACPSPADDWWFVGAGAGISHRSVLTLDNPRSNNANVTIEVYGPKGQVDAPGLSGLLVPAGQSLRLDLETIAPALGDLTVHVSAIRGLVAASMWETWAQSPVAKPVSSWVPAAAAPAGQSQVIGLPGKLSQGTLLIGNPSATSAVVRLKVVNATATFTPIRHQELTVPPESTASVAIDDLVTAGVGSLQIQSSVPVSAGLRALRGNVEAYAAPAQRIGAQSTVGLPGGIPTTLVITSPTATRIGVLAIDAHGIRVLDKTITVPAGRTLTLALPATAVAVRVVGDRHDAVAGAVVLDRNGLAVLGLLPTGNAANVPAVVAQPY